MQRYTIFFIVVSVLHVSGGFSPPHHQELKNCTHSIGYMSSLLAATASVGEFQLMGGETARNMYSIDNDKEY
jgi:hypothetical protein